MSYLTDYPSLVFGWLKVSASEQGHTQNHHPSLFNSRILWIPRCCLLIENERNFCHFDNEEGVRKAMDGRRFRRCRLDVGERAFKQTLEASVTGQPSPLRESCTDLRSDGGPINVRERSHTNPHVEPLPESTSVSSAGSSSSKWKNLFRSKAKGNQKLEKRKSSGPLYLDVPSLGSHATAQPPRAYSHECLYSDGNGCTFGSYAIQDDGPWERQHFEGPYIPPCSTSYQMQKNGCVRPVHPSLVQGQEFCFAVIAGDGDPVRYYASQSDEDRRRWMQALRRTAKPELANERHYENSLRLVIQEVKNVSPKKKYFCEILLDGTLNARTTSKAMSSASSDMLFWGEEFEFHNLSNVNTVTIQLRRDPGDKKKKSGGKKAHLAGSTQVSGTAVLGGNSSGVACPVAAVSISTEDIQKRSDTEKWYTAYSSTTPQPPDAPPDPSNPQIRIKARYLRVDVLPQRCYRALQDYLSKNTLFLLRQLESVLSVKTKEELAGTLVNIHYKIHKVDDLLSELTAHEIDNLGDESMVFRGNSFATKAVECYLKTTGEKYLEETLSSAVQKVMSVDQEVEVDPKALGDNHKGLLEDNQRYVRNLVDQFWDRIYESRSRFPVELRRAFSSMRNRLGDLGRRNDLIDQVISACIFLRYICPAILNPVLFRLVREWPSDHRISRAFTLIAKSIQALANFSPFGRKEDYMTFLNEFLKFETPKMRQYLMTISTPRQEGEARIHSLHREDFIDLSYELAVAHQQLSQVLTKLPQDVKSNRLITQLHSILRHLKNVSENDGPYSDPVVQDSNLNGNCGEKLSTDHPPDVQLQQLLYDLDIVDENSKRQQLQLQMKLQQQQHQKQLNDQQHYTKQQQSSRSQTSRQHFQQQRRIYQQNNQTPQLQQNNQFSQPPTNVKIKQQMAQSASQGPPTNVRIKQQLVQPSHQAPQKQTPPSHLNSKQQLVQATSFPNGSKATSDRNQQPLAMSTPKGDTATSPVRRPQAVRQSPFVVPRASEEVCSILSTDSDSCGLASPSRSSWGCEIGPGDGRRGSAHSDVTTNGRDRRVAASANNLTGTGVRMGTRSIQNRSASTSERSVSELEQDVRSLSEELSTIRQHFRQKEEETWLHKRHLEQKEEENRQLKRQLEEKESRIAKLEARISTQDQTTSRLQAALEEVAQTTTSPRYFHQQQQGYGGRRYFPSSASSGSLHSLSLAQSNSTSDIAGGSSSAATPTKPLKQTLC